MLGVTGHERARLVDGVDLALCRQPQPQIVVFAHDQVLIESSYQFQQLAGYHHAWYGNDRLRPHQLVEDPAIRDRPAAGALPIGRIARLVHEDESGIAPAAARMPAQRGHLDLQLCRHPKVVGVEKSDIFALRLAQRGVPCNRRPSAVRQPEHSDARIIEGFQVGSRVCARTVVRDEKFPVLEGLFEHGCK